MIVDLHCHSTVSDGVLAPDKVAYRAHQNGVELWALTDHDEVGGLALAEQTAVNLGMAFVPGVEISVTFLGKTVHIVGLGIDYQSQRLIDSLRYVRAGRWQRAQRISDALAAMGVSNALEGATPYATNPELVSRTHFARFLVDHGYCSSIQEVFTKYLGDQAPAFVPMQWATLTEAVQWIQQAGGVAVIAHPGRYEFDTLQFDHLFTSFKDCGGVGIEVVTGSHAPHQYNEYAQVAKRFGFEASMGSDFHGPSEGRLDLGCLPDLPSGLTPIWHRWLS